MAKWSVRKVSESMVAPAEATPCDTELGLSWLDVWWPSNFMSTKGLVYRPPRQLQLHDQIYSTTSSSSSAAAGTSTTAGGIIRDALSKALVPYYPVAGFVKLAGGGSDVDDDDDQSLLELKVDCKGGQGVWFVEASANCTLEDVGFLDLAAPPSSSSSSSSSSSVALFDFMEQLLPRDPPGQQHHHPIDTILMMQVTEFMCGGFVIGLTFNHTIFDGVGNRMFLKAMSDLAHGVEIEPAAHPVWSRESIHPPPNVPPPPLIFPAAELPASSFDVENKLQIFDFLSDHIDRLKTRFETAAAAVLEDDGAAGRRRRSYCSSFDVVVAKFWKSRCRAMSKKNDDGAVAQLNFNADMRRRMSSADFLPSHNYYYGNCLYFGKVTAPASKVANGSIFEIVRMIQDAKETLRSDFLALILHGRVRPDSTAPSAEDAVHVNDWSTVGLEKVDFAGDGEGPVNVFPSPLRFVSGSNKCLLVKPPPSQVNGLRLIMNCVKKEHLASFMQEMMRDDEDDVKF